jgi:L-asparaginase II
MPACLAEVTRGELVESRHDGAVVVTDPDGKIIASAGDVDEVIFFRSAAKPFQAVPLITSGAAEAYGFGSEEVALACASHDATPAHQRVAARMLAKIGLDEDALRCGIAPPADKQEAARVTLGLKEPSQLQCECSGEHAGMVVACKHLGEPLDSYVTTDHPLQRRIHAIVARVTGCDEDELVVGTDGCRIPTFGAPLHSFARAYAILAAPEPVLADDKDDLALPLTRLRDAMTAHPWLIGGDQVLDTDIMRVTNGRLVAKLGAEGLLCMAVPERRPGIAITASDGTPRGLGPAATAVLEQLDLADADELKTLHERHDGKVTTFAGEEVGQVRPALRLEFR